LLSTLPVATWSSATVLLSGASTEASSTGVTVTLAGGTLTLGANGDYTFTPNANWNGTVPQVSYTTNTIALSCGALPDVGSTVIWGWGSRVNYINRANAAGEQPRVYLKFAHVDIAPGTLITKFPASPRVLSKV
jgi:hypothetical protein